MCVCVCVCVCVCARARGHMGVSRAHALQPAEVMNKGGNIAQSLDSLPTRHISLSKQTSFYSYRLQFTQIFALKCTSTEQFHNALRVAWQIGLLYFVFWSPFLLSWRLVQTSENINIQCVLLSAHGQKMLDNAHPTNEKKTSLRFFDGEA